MTQDEVFEIGLQKVKEDYLDEQSRKFHKHVYDQLSKWNKEQQAAHGMCPDNVYWEIHRKVWAYAGLIAPSYLGSGQPDLTHQLRLGSYYPYVNEYRKWQKRTNPKIVKKRREDKKKRALAAKKRKEQAAQKKKLEEERQRFRQIQITRNEKARKNVAVIITALQEKAPGTFEYECVINDECTYKDDANVCLFRWSSIGAENANSALHVSLIRLNGTQEIIDMLMTFMWYSRETGKPAIYSTPLCAGSGEFLDADKSLAFILSAMEAKP